MPLSEILLLGFLAGALVLWLSAFGYLMFLRRCAGRAHGTRARETALPDIAVIVPVRNETDRVLEKLDDLRRTDYPADRITVIVADGGSTDGTVERVQASIDRGAAVRLVHLPDACGKSAQLNHVLRSVPHDIVVVTDVDSRLAPNCVRELVGCLLRDPGTAVVGAVVRPETSLLEERLHWRLLGLLWWLEGEALSAAVVSGVCYAARRATIAPLPNGARAEDVYLTLAAAARGHRVRLCRSAHATELRVPQSPRELVRFRQRRGANYVQELLRPLPRTGSPVGWRIARLVRLWHFRVAPKMVIVLVAVGVALLWTAHWPWVVAVATAFAVPFFGALQDRHEPGPRPPWWRVALAASRLAGLTWYALLTIPRQPGEPS